MPTVGRPVSRGWSMITVGSVARGGEQRIALTHRVDDDAVDRGARQESAAGHEHQSETLLLGHRAQPGHHRRGGRVVERVGQRRVADEPDRARPAAAQPARERVRPGIAERLRAVEDPLAQLGRELIRAG